VRKRRGAIATLVAIAPLVALLGGLPPALAAQIDVSGYSLGVGSYSAESDFLPAGSTALGRGRVMLDYAADWFSFESAYEHIIQYSSSGAGFSFTNPGGSRVSTDWLPLDWTIHESDKSSWRHRLDRLSVRADTGPLEVTVGRTRSHPSTRRIHSVSTGAASMPCGFADSRARSQKSRLWFDRRTHRPAPR